MTQEADYIIIGAGAAGCVLANRLSANPALRILLIEAGGANRNPLLRVPLMSGLLLRGRIANWAFTSDPEPNLNGRSLPWPRGKGLGGSTAINGMVFTRGLPRDYDAWAAAGLDGWSFADCLPAFRRLERHDGGESPCRGGAGPLPVSRPLQDNPLFAAFLAAAEAAGHPRTDDFNGPAPAGFGWYDFTIRRGRRVSAADAWLRPACRRGNVRVLTRTLLWRILFEGHRAVGVEVLRHGRLVRLHAAREVILAAGVVGSPMALLHSGIGDPDALRALGIPVVAACPEVGRNLQDHLLVRIEHGCPAPVTLAPLQRVDRAAAALLRALLFGSGPAACFPLSAGGFLAASPGGETPDLQCFLFPAPSTATLRLPGLPSPPASHDGHGFFVSLYAMRPASRGEITLRSADPRDPPHIRPNHLSAPEDLVLLREGVKRLREVLAQPPMALFRGPELSPGATVRSDAEIDAFIRRTAHSAFHGVGTCRMGADAAAVVDARLRVRGVEGLRVADASVMPAIPSSNTAAPTMMIAERAAAFLLAGE